MVENDLPETRAVISLAFINCDQIDESSIIVGAGVIRSVKFKLS